MTWRDEKAKAQATMRDIIEQVPKDVAVSVDMAATGTLLNCSPADSEGEKKYLWAGGATVALKPGVDIDSIVKVIENHYRESRFGVDSDRGLFGNYRIQMSPPGENSSYLVTKGENRQISIDGWSECFQLPDGLYPGGDF